MVVHRRWGRVIPLGQWFLVGAALVLVGCGSGVGGTSARAAQIDPHAAKTELTSIREKVSSEVFGSPGGFEKKADSGSSDVDNQEFWMCDGPDGDGASYMVFFESIERAEEADYERAVEVVQGLPGWTLGSKDAEPENGLTMAVLVNEEVGGITVSLTRSDGVLHLDLESHCVAGATEE